MMWLCKVGDEGKGMATCGGRRQGERGKSNGDTARTRPERGSDSDGEVCWPGPVHGLRPDQASLPPALNIAESLLMSSQWYVEGNSLTRSLKFKKTSNSFDQERFKHTVSPAHPAVALPPSPCRPGSSIEGGQRTYIFCTTTFTDC